MTREGIAELLDYLKDDLPKITLEQAKFKAESRSERMAAASGGGGISGEHSISWKRSETGIL